MRIAVKVTVALGAVLTATGLHAAPAPVDVASYRIEARLDPEARLLRGSQRVRWQNTQAIPAMELRFHLYWNAWRNNRSTWMLEDRIRGRSDRGDETRPGDWGWIEVDSMRLAADGGGGVDLTAGLRYAWPDDGNRDDRTVLVAPLPVGVAPGETVEVEVSWRARVPRTFARTGYRGDFYFIAHWFPKLGVFEAGGWNCHQYHAATEYYADFGDYDVTLTLPSGFVVGATGREAERRDNADGTRSLRFLQEDVHGFAWAASPDFVVLEERFDVDGLPPVDLRLLLQPEHRRQAERHFAATRAALELYGRWYGPYPYGHLTIVDPAFGAGAGGMEYPTLFTAGTRLFSPPSGGSPEHVTIHEAGHQFWYGLVANNEFEHAWLDEGLNTFSAARVFEERFGPTSFTRRFFAPPGTKSDGGFLPLPYPELPRSPAVDETRLARYRRAATWDAPAKPTFRYYPAAAAAVSYDKTALWLATLERHLGWERLREILATFFERSRFRHPGPEDFLAVVDQLAGQDLGWFFEQVLGKAGDFDYEVARVSSEPATLEGWSESAGELALSVGEDRAASGETTYRTEVVVRRLGEATFPVDLLMAFEDGSQVTRRWDGIGRWRLFVEERPSQLVYAEVDPERILLLDLNPSNNSRLVTPKATLPAVKWASKWLIWLQDLLMTFSFFA